MIPQPLGGTGANPFLGCAHVVVFIGSKTGNGFSSPIRMRLEPIAVVRRKIAPLE